MLNYSNYFKSVNFVNKFFKQLEVIIKKFKNLNQISKILLQYYKLYYFGRFPRYAELGGGRGEFGHRKWICILYCVMWLEKPPRTDCHINPKIQSNLKNWGRFFLILNANSFSVTVNPRSYSYSWKSTKHIEFPRTRLLFWIFTQNSYLKLEPLLPF